MKLLKIDHKLIALHSKTSKTFNITDHLNGQTIRQIIYNETRVCILTTTKLYYLYKDPDYKLVDITQNIEKTGTVSHIKFITNLNVPQVHPCRFNIITNTDKRYICKIKRHIFKSTKYIYQLDTKDIITVPSNRFGYIYKDDNKYVVKHSNYFGDIEKLYTIDELPTSFISPNKIICTDKLMVCKYMTHSLRTVCTDVSHAFNSKYYCTKNGDIYYTTPNLDIKDTGHNIRRVSNHTIIDYDDKYMIILNKQTNKLEHHINKKGTLIQNHIDNSYYYTENLLQYINNNWLVKWTSTNHHTFDKYTDKFVKVILKCCRYSVYRKYIPKGVLFMIIQFAI